jgi:multiple sugar transport system permease protein
VVVNLGQAAVETGPEPRTEPVVGRGGGWLKYGFVGPTLIFLLVMNLFPLGYSIYLSFTDAPLAATDAPVAWVGGENYGRVFAAEENFAGALRVTGAFVALAVAIELALGFGLAMALRDRYRMPGRALVLTVLLIPMMLSPAVMGIFFRLILSSNYGILNQLLAELSGKPMDQLPGWLLDPGLQFASIIMIDVWMWTPFMMLISMAGLNAIPGYLYEAAEIDRASAWTVFRRITLPMCLPLLLLAVLLRVTDAIKQFDLVMAISGPTQERTQTLSVKLYQTMFGGGQNLGLGTAYAIVCLVIVIAIAVLFTRYLDRIQGKA